MNSSKTVPQTSAELTDSQQLPTSDTLLSQSLGSSADSLSQNQLANGLTANATNNNALNTLNNNRSGMMSGGYGSSMYNSGFSSYGGGFGSSYGGGMYGSNSYMGMGMGGYSGMGGGMMMNQQNLQQGQQPGFRDEYQGVLNGFNSMLNIMGAGIGMVGYGTTFFQITKKALVFIFKGMSNLSYRILGIAYLKKLYNWVTSAELQQDFAKAFELTTKVEKQSFAKKFLGKALIVIRVLSGLGFYFTQQNLRKRMMQMKKDQENFNNFDNELGPLIYDNEALPKTDKKDIDLITINMNSDKAEILDELDHNLTQEEIEEEKENFQGSTNEQEDHTDIELTDSKEDVHITDGNLQNAFENIMTQEKNYIQQTQVRSEEFWKHTEPATEPIAEININNNVIPTYNNPFIFNTISEQNNVVSTPEIEMNLPNFNNTMSEIVTPSQNTILPNLTSSVSTLSSQPATAVKKSVKPWMKNVQQQ